MVRQQTLWHRMNESCHTKLEEIFVKLLRHEKSDDFQKELIPSLYLPKFTIALKNV